MTTIAETAHTDAAVDPNIRPVVVVTRHPDASLHFDTHAGEGEPLILEVDLGLDFDGSFDGHENAQAEFEEWREGQLEIYDGRGLSRVHPAFADYEHALDQASPESD